ncbi:PQQ-dependent sugar dehydrogenase [Sphingosinicella microcystinivorans]|uniref:PQQ-dependent sugar dehydrogenase n=1 Tax=Sphingosinicella microcystinivorans TaxID=335406 RepID=UPI0022F3F6B5|nr:PQQ-dependent sugar dehydrogenase [Sphingosinicella microcystinivorans]WBX84827.1 PQQ-dependent sugar dehydrogenase [Sphingosinicella microcystinivorans]
MIRTFTALALVSAVSLAACGANGNTNRDTEAAAPTAKTGKPFTAAEMGKFEEPWALAFLPDGRILVTEKKGALKLVRLGGDTRDVAGVPKVDYGGQGGLGDVALHPDFANNGYIYLSYAEAGDGDTRGAAVARGKLVLDGGAPRIEALQVIWRQEPKVAGRGHYGHRIAFGPDGMMYVSSGERQKFDPAQDLNANLGKIVRLSDTGMIPSDNPFYDQGRVKAQVWAYGIRNPLGIDFDDEGRLWEMEMGPAGGDELNLIRKGVNYGYPKVSNGDHYDGTPIPDHAPGDGFEPPKLFWNPSISPSSLLVYKGDLFPEWKGDAFIGALSGEALIRVDLDGETATKADQWPMEARIRAVEQGPDGAIWLLEDGENGRLLKLTPAY